MSWDGTSAVGYFDGQCRSGDFPVSGPLTTDASAELRAGSVVNTFGGIPETIDVDELAVYPTALGSHRVDAHWSAAQSPTKICAAAPLTPYGQSIVSDTPTMYLRLGELAVDPQARVAHDPPALRSGRTYQRRGRVHGFGSHLRRTGRRRRRSGRAVTRLGCHAIGVRTPGRQ